MASSSSWVKTITSPFRKACTFLNQQQQQHPKNKKSKPGALHFLRSFIGTGHENRVMDLHGEVMACAYEDVQVMWSMLDKSKSTRCDVSS